MFWTSPYGDWVYDRCGRCGHVDLREPPSPDQLQHYYDDVYQLPQDGYRRSVMRRYVSAVELAAAHVGLGRCRVLEVGCNTGLLLLALRERGWEVAGTEPGKQFRTLAQGRGLDVRSGLQDWSQERFHLIVSFHVLEHVPDANADLRAIRDRMEAGGMVVLKTPNASSLPARLFPGEWEWTSPPAHLRLYSPTSLRLALLGAGFENIGMRSTPGNGRPFPFLAARALGLRIRGRDRRYTPGLDPRHIPVSGRSWYRASERIGRALSFMGFPFQPVFDRLMLAPELEAIAVNP